MVPPLGAPTLHWRFDESSTVAMFLRQRIPWPVHGLSGAVPDTSGMVPPVQFANPASRAFTVAQRQQVRLDNPPAALMPTNSVTATTWFRTRYIDSSSYSLIVNVGDGYFINLAQGAIWSGRRVGAGRYEYCTASVTGFLDGKWHHVAAVWAPTGMKIYLDGIERGTSTRGEAIAYDVGLGILVGRRSSCIPTSSTKTSTTSGCTCGCSPPRRSSFCGGGPVVRSPANA